VQRAAVLAFVNDFVTAAMNRQLHAPDNHFVAEALQAMVRSLQHAAHVGVEMPLALQCSDDRIHHDGQPLDGPSLQAGSLLRSVADREIAVLSFLPNLDVDEANRVFDLLLLPHNRQALARSRRDETLRAFGIRNVRVTLRSPAEPSNHRTHLDRTKDPLLQYQDLAYSLQQNHVRAHRDQELAVTAVEDVVERTVSRFEEPSALLALAAQDDVDRFTIGHSVRVALLALQVARGCGASREQLVRVGTAALMHDIGKSKVSQEVLWKRGRLSPDEWKEMMQHPRLGAHILLEQHEGVDPGTVGAAFCHHMGPTGSGYPRPAVPFVPSGTSRLIRVCDVFEALTSVRPYKRALTPIEAYAVMFRSEKDFDPAWLRRFVSTLGLFPTGTRVLLDDGADALVVGQGTCPERPIVRLLTGPGGSDLPAGAPDELTIGMPQHGTVRRIAAISTHERCLRVPEFDLEDPEILTLDPAHACMSTTMVQDAQCTGRGEQAKR
jgi:HD-GYP domain-containing protein (c-di-GMP phosphodiesterase class II)